MERYFDLYLNAGVSTPLVINCNQYDKSETWLFTLYDETGIQFSPASGSIVGLKADGNTIVNAGTVNSSGQVVIQETEQMTAVAGKNEFELILDASHGTANFILLVERRPGNNATPSESDISLIEQAIEAASNITQVVELTNIVNSVRSEMTNFIADNAGLPNETTLSTDEIYRVWKSSAATPTGGKTVLSAKVTDYDVIAVYTTISTLGGSSTTPEAHYFNAQDFANKITTVVCGTSRDSATSKDMFVPMLSLICDSDEKTITCSSAKLVAWNGTASSDATVTESDSTNVQGSIVRITGIRNDQLDTEVVNARVGKDGTRYNTLKERLDAETAIVDSSLTVSGAAADAKKVGDELGDLKSQIDNNTESDISNYFGLLGSIQQVYDGDALVSFKLYGVMLRGQVVGGNPSTDSKRCYAKFPMTTKGEKIYFDDTSYRANFAWWRNGAYASQSGWQTTSPFTFSASEDVQYVYITLDPKDGTSVIPLNIASQTTYFQKSLTGKEARIKTAYISASGNDTNAGDADHPLKTVNKALEYGAERIMMLAGDYRQQIDLSKSITGRVEIMKASDTGSVYFRPSNPNIATAETKVEGHTKVYSSAISVSLTANNKWLFQRNVQDSNTLIDNTERMPQQRGVTHRMKATIIRKCGSNNLSDALDEIDNSNGYLWYIAGDTLYFSRPGTVSSSQPIAYSDGTTKLFVNGTNRNTIIMTGIDTEFLPINLDNTTDSVVSDCSASMVYGDGCITFDHATNVTLIRCEAAAAFNGSTGDGINAHGATGGTQRAHKTTGRLIDCWSHDNNDDGFSDHECCESEVYGGLFEYNGKGGITPSYGSHCKCIGVYSRQNYNGFYYTGASQPSELGVYGQLECIDCIAENNQRGTSQNNAGYLIESTGNRMILSNCKSLNNKIGYYATSNTLMTIIDCGSYGDTTVKTGSGTKTIINTTAVSN